MWHHRITVGLNTTQDFTSLIIKDVSCMATTDVIYTPAYRRRCYTAANTEVLVFT